MDFKKNIFEDFLRMQNKMWEEQVKMYQNFMKSFQMDNEIFQADLFKNFKQWNNMDFFQEYKKFADGAEKNFRDMMEKVPNVNLALEAYKENIKMANRLYQAYEKLLTEGNYQSVQEALKKVYEVWNEQFINLARKNLESFLPAQSQEWIENFHLDRFLQPFLAQQKKALDFYEEAFQQEPQLMTDRIKNFYNEWIEKVAELPTVGMKDEWKAQNKENLKAYLDLQLKLLELNLFLKRQSQSLGVKAQRECLNNLEREEGVETFADFYESWTKELEKAYEELIQSKEYQQLSQEVIDLVKVNRSKYDAYLEEKLQDSPIFTAKKAQDFFGDFTKVRDDVEIGKMTQNEMSKDMEVLRMNVEKDKRELSQKFLDLQNKSEQGHMDLKQALEQVKLNDRSAEMQKELKTLEDEKKAAKEEIENLKRELAQLKAADSSKEVEGLKREIAQLKAAQDEVNQLKGELESLKNSKSSQDVESLKEELANLKKEWESVKVKEAPAKKTGTTTTKKTTK